MHSLRSPLLLKYPSGLYGFLANERCKLPLTLLYEGTEEAICEALEAGCMCSLCCKAWRSREEALEAYREATGFDYS